MEFVPFEVDGALFTPLAYVERMDLPDFGCEGRPEEEEPLGALWVVRPEGCRFLRVGERALLASDFQDDLWIGIQNGQMVLVPKERGKCRPAVPGEALEAALHQPGLEV